METKRAIGNGPAPQKRLTPAEQLKMLQDANAGKVEETKTSFIDTPGVKVGTYKYELPDHMKNKPRV